ncbi:hypothetical protein KFE25_005758 [Diacronema lutheri]|uniref:Uncharacterized protein n=1 Tax=Diacronema lutheri TaxID=2081491 RepID=A0A8J6C503_DIALT|nr:hypothetical protein KFE25_005758 [Diacronema lutheri]
MEPTMAAVARAAAAFARRRTHVAARAASTVSIAPPPKDARESLQALAQLRGEVALVTGAATGIGRAVAQLFVEAGARVHAFDLAPCELPGAASTVRVDVSDVPALTAALRSAIDAERGRVDHLVCSAGLWTFGDVDETTEAEFDRLIGVNVKGSFFALAAVLPAMKAQRRGSVVIVGSDQSFVGKPGQSLYGLTKGATAQLVKSTAAQYAQLGVRVNAVCPGTIDTPLMRGAVRQIARMKGQSAEGEEDLVTWLKTAQPMPRLGEPEEIALAIAMVSKVPFMTGALVAVDGGYTCQ